MKNMLPVNDFTVLFRIFSSVERITESNQTEAAVVLVDSKWVPRASKITKDPLNSRHVRCRGFGHVPS